MFLKWGHESIRLTGRWDRRNEDVVSTTNTGGIIEIAYYGEMATLKFDVKDNIHPFPHLWIQLDNGPRIESAVEPYIHIQSSGTDNKRHYLKIIFKSAMEHQHRWYSPLAAKLSFLGVDVEKPGQLPEDKRKIMEFVGDSITEGVLIDVDCGISCPETRVYQDDVCATYAWLTAEKLNLRPRINGYGAVGTTKSGSGSVPKASKAYSFVYDNCPLTEDKPDYIVINHGANDRKAASEVYINGYHELLKIIRELNPESRIICLSAFVGVYSHELKKMISKFNVDNNDCIYFIDSANWIPAEPLHPLRDGHKAIADKLTEILKEFLVPLSITKM